MKLFRAAILLSICSIVMTSVGQTKDDGAPKIGIPFDVIPYSQTGGGSEQYFHGPSTIVSANGNLLVTTAQGRSHGVGVIVQTRSKDRGNTWNFEGIIYDHSNIQSGGSAYNPPY